MSRRREALGLSRADLAKKAGVGRSTISYIESGRENKDNPSLNTVEVIAKALKLPAWYMLFEEADFDPGQEDSLKRFARMYYTLHAENRRKALEYICDLTELQNK